MLVSICLELPLEVYDPVLSGVPQVVEGADVLKSLLYSVIWISQKIFPFIDRKSLIISIVSHMLKGSNFDRL